MVPKTQLDISFCITTLNRADMLDSTIRNIASQMTDRVELVIYDGGSEDETAAVVTALQNDVPNVVYERAKQNGGVDNDYGCAANLASGKYIWFFSDDDLLKPGAVQLVLDRLGEKYDLILLNSEIRDENCDAVIKEQFIERDHDKVYGPQDFETFFVENAAYLSFIGGTIVRRDVWQARNNDHYFGTMFAMAGALLDTKYDGDILVMHNPEVILRYGNASWAERSFGITLINWPQVIWSLPTISDEAKQQVCGRRPWLDLRRLLIFKARGAYSLGVYRSIFVNADVPRFKRLLALMISVFPGKLVNIFFLLYFSSIGRRHGNFRLQLVDLKQSKYYFFRR